MKVQELYDHIVQHMTPEDALKRLLATSVEVVENANLEDPNSRHSPYFTIVACATQLGWGFAIESDAETLQGLVIGTPEYINSIFDKTKEA